MSADLDKSSLEEEYPSEEEQEEADEEPLHNRGSMEEDDESEAEPFDPLCIQGSRAKIQADMLSHRMMRTDQFDVSGADDVEVFRAYVELADRYKEMDAVSDVPKRNMLAKHLREVVDLLEQKGDQIASLYDCLTFKDKPLPGVKTRLAA
ncbi:hypothetical protein B0H11DRAFT_1901171 [Mycena galericulata]|nr:hypothetical protein B0H11DRAFT_1901171 [Mycena galericulata]